MRMTIFKGKTVGVTAVLVIAVVGVGAMIFHRAAAPQQTVDFNRDIRPIFNANCMACHGGVKQASNVSFSYREQALGKGKSGRPTVVPGNPQASELIARVTAKDTDVRMPLNAAPLTEKQIGLLRQWIKEGAPWSDYWAFVPPKPQALPAVRNAHWARQPLDRFILARLEKEKLAPSPEADKAELLRRVSLDLTGMPPTPQEQAAFLADASANAYEKQVDRLLASPRYGERWASMWLDVARYGDSKGFEKDKSRTVWPYRDWVIDAFNRNMPFDQFVIRQLAGDELPNPGIDDMIATSFHRQTQANDEGGTDDEEFRISAVMDRASTTWSALNGVSFNCVQCHSHPYDPIRHNEYYKFMAFFNTQRDADIAFDNARPDDWPILDVPTDKARYGEAYRLQRHIHATRAKLVAASRAAEADPKQWRSLPIQQAGISEALAIKALLDKAQLKAGGPKKGDDDKRAKRIEQLQKDLVRAEAHPPEASLQIKGGMAQSKGTVPRNTVFELTAPFNVTALTALKIEVPPANAGEAAHSPEKGFIVNHVDAWVVRPDGGMDKIAIRLMAPDAVDSLIGNVAREMKASGKAKTKGYQKDKSGRPVVMEKQAADKDAKPRDPDAVMTSVAASSGLLADPSLFFTRWVVAVPDAPLHLPAGTKLKLQLTQTEAVNQTNGAAPRMRLATSNDARWTALAHDAGTAKAFADLEQMDHDLAAIPSVEVPVMAEEAGYEKRQTLEYDRGSFLTQIGPNLRPDTPALFPKMPANVRHNRLALAKWFFQPGQPLTARVAVNRYWEQLFGTGIVETQEDFGSAGDLPSHPALLDWLALHFQNDLHWNQKALVREIVTSATYRQSAMASAALREKDPRNRLLARGPQQRLTAEMVRDQAMLASGLLNPQMGGPPVMPAQPDGIWNVVSNNPERWVNATGPDRYRRAVYTFVKRTSLYPSFVTFDAADRTMTTPRRISTNTPLQALVTLNDPVYREATIALAGRMLKDKGSLDDRLNYGARMVLSRDLVPAELAPLHKLYVQAAGGSSPASLAGYTAVGTALFNLDAALTR
jgi:mono/diheme cytochrome c family protein